MSTGASPREISLDFVSLRRAYATRDLTPVKLVQLLLDRLIDGADHEGIWISRISPEGLLAAARQVMERQGHGERLPLFGLPFAVKDNIDVAGMETTAGCPAFAYMAERNATVVDRLLAAGALLLGKTNMDQFATGLVGTRSPYGIPRNPFDDRYICGGSSSGSAAAVARGLCSFALGTDTAGSGRVPAAFTNLVGLKPGRGLVSTAGVVPACRSLDCVSLFALTCPDAEEVLEIARGHDPRDPFSRPDADGMTSGEIPSFFRLGIPDALEFFGDGQAETVFRANQAGLEQLGGQAVVVDFTPFAEAARLLYEGPWVAERMLTPEKLLATTPDSILPVLRQILADGPAITGVETFRGLHRLQVLRAQTDAVWRSVDVMVVPSTPTIYPIAAVVEEPLVLNRKLGRYTNFVNLLDLSALAVPGGFRNDGLPAGFTLIAPWGREHQLLAIGERWLRHANLPLGATGAPLPSTAEQEPPGPQRASGRKPPGIPLAVVGAHLAGQPLNQQLLDLGATFVRATRTAPSYRLYLLPNTKPPKPGLVRVEEGTGSAIELEIWTLPPASFGRFVGEIPGPLGIGTIRLANGTTVQGFLCEAVAVTGARDISHFGGWRAFVSS